MSGINSPPEMSATARDRAFDEMSREHPRVLPGVGGFQMLYMKYLSIVTSTVLPTNDKYCGPAEQCWSSVKRC